MQPWLEIDISRQWTIGPPVLEIWWSCKISGGPDVANRQCVCLSKKTADIIYILLYKAFEQSLQYMTFTEKDMKAIKWSVPINFKKKYCYFLVSFSVLRQPDHHLALSGGPTVVLVDWGHRNTLISSPAMRLRVVA